MILLLCHLCCNWTSAIWNLWDVGMFRCGQRLIADMGSGDKQQALCSSSKACSNSSSPAPSWLLCAFKMWIHGFCRTCLFFPTSSGILISIWVISLPPGNPGTKYFQVSLWRHLVYFFHMPILQILQIKWLSGVFLSWCLWFSGS